MTREAATGAGFIDVQSLTVAAVGNKGLVTQDAALVHVSKRPGVQLGAFEVVQRAGRIAVSLAFTLDGAMQHAQLKTRLFGITPEQSGQVAPFTDFGVTDAMYDGQGFSIFFNDMTFDSGPKMVTLSGQRMEASSELSGS